MNPAHFFIMAGGSGERFWPLSRQLRPKQILPLLDQGTLLELAIQRTLPLAGPGQLTLLANTQLGDTLRTSLPQDATVNLVLEPAKRDTAPAAALATAIAYHSGPESVAVLLPADPWIGDDALYRADLELAVRLARDHDALVTLGIPPTFAATGFGYLELGDFLPETGDRARRVVRFVEKPDTARAQSYLTSGRHAWNAGIFAWRASVFLREAERLVPELAAFIKAYPGPAGSEAYLAEHFSGLPKISVDYAIMEKAASVLSVAASFPWDDIGSWPALAGHFPVDAAGNAHRGVLAAHAARNNLVYSPHKPVALCGVEDLVVVDTPDALLVCHRSQAQEIKKLLPLLPPGLH
ncbi:MAG: sugar phosphate nucleotidyltransferase [Candidatus Methylacidiphilales bacterium]|nr:sugar phosphate nucleotidyltransferase [Candidatus Methylacidiphilales bacterium]